MSIYDVLSSSFSLSMEGYVAKEKDEEGVGEEGKLYAGYNSSMYSVMFTEMR